MRRAIPNYMYVWGNSTIRLEVADIRCTSWCCHVASMWDSLRCRIIPSLGYTEIRWVTFMDRSEFRRHTKGIGFNSAEHR